MILSQLGEKILKGARVAKREVGFQALLKVDVEPRSGIGNREHHKEYTGIRGGGGCGWSSYFDA